MSVVSAIGLILSCVLSTSQVARTSSFVSIWQRPGYFHCYRGATLQNDAVATDKGVLNLTNGLYFSPESQTMPPSGWRGFPESPGPKTILFQNRTLFLVWDTDKCRIASDGRSSLYQFRPGTTVLLSTVNQRGTDLGNWTRTGDPDRGTLMFCDVSEAMSSERDVDYLFLTNPLRLSPLRACVYFDITHPEQGVLGVPLPTARSYEDIAAMANTPTSPLMLGDPFTGKPLWRRSGYTNGRWMDRRWILAQQAAGRQSWRMLDGRTGRDAPIALPAMLGDLPGAHVQVIGPYLLIYNVKQNATFAFRLDS